MTTAAVGAPAASGVTDGITVSSAPGAADGLNVLLSAPGVVDGLNVLSAPGVVDGTTVPAIGAAGETRRPATHGAARTSAARDAARTSAARDVANRWLPRSPCDDGCLPPPGHAPSVGPLRLAARLAAASAVVLASLGIAAVVPVLRSRVRDWLTRQWFRTLLVALGVRLVVRAGARFGPAGTGVLVVADHVSWLDVIALNAVQPCRMVAKHEVHRWHLVGWLATVSGTIFIDRERLRALPGTVAEICAGLRAGSRVVVFPEATTWCGRSRGPYRPAAFQAALDAGAAVRPVGLRFSLPPGQAPTTAAAFVGSCSLWTSLCRVAALRGLAVEVKPLPELAGVDYPNRRAIATAARDAVTAAFAGAAGTGQAPPPDDHPPASAPKPTHPTRPRPTTRHPPTPTPAPRPTVRQTPHHRHQQPHDPKPTG
jgi:1-acyl-sn-glycerol-3-phosphate acyltransferase